MRSRRHSDEAMMSANTPINNAAITKNMRAFTPPKNKIPMAITAITMKAPMSGSASNNKPTMATAVAMGVTAEKNFSFTSILRTM